MTCSRQASSFSGYPSRPEAMRAGAKVARGNAKSLLEGARSMGGVGKAALKREPGDGNVRQRSLSQQISKKLDAQMKHVPLERGFQVGEDTMEGPLRNAELSGKG